MGNYLKNFKPYTYMGEDGCKTLWESSYIEVGTKCFHYPGLEDDENTILLYSALLSLRNDPVITFTDIELDVCYYNVVEMAKLLNMKLGPMGQSLSKLTELHLISVVDCVRYYSSVGLIINKDLRYDSDSKKSVIRAYDRMFSYSEITKEMAMVYSYYLKMSKTLSRQEYETISLRSASEALGYSTERIIHILEDMEQIGLVKIENHSDSESVELAVDFSRLQPEEKSFQQDLYQQEQIKKEKEKKQEEERKSKIDPGLEAAFAAADQADIENYEKWLQNHPDTDFDPLEPVDSKYPEKRKYYVEMHWSGKGSNLLYPKVTIKPSPGITIFG